MVWRGVVRRLAMKGSEPSEDLAPLAVLRSPCQLKPFLQLTAVSALPGAFQKKFAGQAAGETGHAVPIPRSFDHSGNRTWVVFARGHRHRARAFVHRSAPPELQCEAPKSVCRRLQGLHEG
jgi:hypothetical protein